MNQKEKGRGGVTGQHQDITLSHRRLEKVGGNAGTIEINGKTLNSPRKGKQIKVGTRDFHRPIGPGLVETRHKIILQREKVHQG